MLHTIVDYYDIFRNDDFKPDIARSSNPYDYIRTGYYLENAVYFGGKNNVSFNCNIPSAVSSDLLGASHK